jgi:hypothetical protein
VLNAARPKAQKHPRRAGSSCKCCACIPSAHAYPKKQVKSDLKKRFKERKEEGKKKEKSGEQKVKSEKKKGRSPPLKGEIEKKKIEKKEESQRRPAEREKGERWGTSAESGPQCGLLHVSVVACQL